MIAWVCAAVVLGVLGTHTHASAQDGGWIVVAAAVSGEDRAGAARAAGSEATRLRSRGETVLDDETIAARLRERVSTEYAPVDDGARSRFIDAVDTALTDVAGGEHRAALTRIDPLLREAEASSAALNRDDDSARAVSNLCMLGVRAALDSRLAQDAAERARNCVRLVPDIDPAALLYQGRTPMHPPAVRALVDDARARLGAEGTEVRVEASGDARACTLRVAGRPLATSLPATVRLFRGTHQVQVECEARPGRIHHVTVSAYQVTVEVDPALDRALDDGPPLSLVYASSEDRAAHLDDHLERLANGLGVANVGVVSTGDARGVSVRHWRRSAERRAGAAAARRSETSGGADSQATGLPLAGPLVLYGIGAVLTAVAIYALIASGDCTEMVGERCVEEQRLASPAIWLWSAGALLAIGGATVWLAVGGGPDRRTEPHATARLRLEWTW